MPETGKIHQQLEFRYGFCPSVISKLKTKPLKEIIARLLSNILIDS
ncbi:MAG: hypothetical protein ACKO7N_10490 [Candidatus Nitrosotenuis sp.]